MVGLKSGLKKEKHKIMVMAVLLAVACFLTYYFHLVLGICVIFSHFFYIPIILTSFWWKRKGLVVAVFLAVILILSHHIHLGNVNIADEYSRVFMFIVISSVVVLLSEKLAESEKAVKHVYSELDQIFQTAADGMRVIDKDFNMLRVNKTFLDLVGISEDEAVGKKCYDVFPGPRCHAPDCPLTRIMEGEETLEEEVEKERMDGRKIFCIVTTTPFVGPDDELIGIVEDYKDITERKRAEEALRASEKQLRETKDYLHNIITSSADAIVVVDMNGIVRSWNKGAEDYMGYTADEVIGTSNKKFFADPGEAERIIETIQREGEIKNYRTTVLRKDGKPVHVSMSAALLKDKNGMLTGTVRVSRDITREVELGEKLKEERDKLNSIFENMADGVYIVSKDYEVEFMNKVLKDDFGNQVGAICYKVFHNREEPCPLCKHSKVMKGEEMRWEWHSRRTNKTYDLIETPMKNVDGGILKLTIFRDITEILTKERQLAHLSRLSTLGEMATAMAHEINQPLTLISMAAESILRDTKKNRIDMSLLPQDAEDILHNVRRIDTIITHMRTFVRQPGEIRAMEPEQMLNNAFIIVGEQLRVHNITVTRHIEEKLPSIEVDPNQLEQVFLNILTNAHQALDEKGKEAERASESFQKQLKCSILQEGDYVVFEFADNGCGVPDDIKPRIFEPFFTTKEPGQGTGLGLSIAYGIVTQSLKGRIWVEDNEMGGATFKVALPIKENKTINTSEAKK